jgi:integrase
VAPRRRHASRRDWPRGLRGKRNADGSTYYSWIHPETGKEWGIGSVSFAKAVEQAREANVEVNRKKLSLAERIQGGAETLGIMLDRFDKHLVRRELAENTQRSNKSRAKRTLAMLGEHTLIRSISTQVIAEALDTIAHGEHKPRLAQSMRSYWKDFFRYCVAQGVLERNPVEVTESVKVEVKRSRLTFEVFMQLYRRTECLWLSNAMALALVTVQGRNEIANATAAQFRDRGWYVERKKTKAKLFIPFELRLNAFGMSLEDVYRQCRSTGVLSKYLIHQTDTYGNSARGDQIWIDTISRRFSDELEKLQLDFGDKAAPTFHEIRSLGVRLYKQQGGVDVQALAAHADAEMTELYANPRGAEYVRVKIDL